MMTVTTESRCFDMLPQNGMHRDCFESCLAVRNRRCRDTAYSLASPTDRLAQCEFFGWGATRPIVARAVQAAAGRRMWFRWIEVGNCSTNSRLFAELVGTQKVKQEAIKGFGRIQWCRLKNRNHRWRGGSVRCGTCGVCRRRAQVTRS